MGKLIRATEAARIVGCSYWTLREWRQKGLISSTPVNESVVNGSLLYDEDEMAMMKTVFRRHRKKGVAEMTTTDGEVNK